jgi:hypothetical protein
MSFSGKIHTPAVLTPWKISLVPLKQQNIFPRIGLDALEKANLLPLIGFEPLFLERPVHSLVTTLITVLKIYMLNGTM